MTQLGDAPDPEKLNALINEVDEDGDCEIDFQVILMILSFALNSSKLSKFFSVCVCVSLSLPPPLTVLFIIHDLTYSFFLSPIIGTSFLSYLSLFYLSQEFCQIMHKHRDGAFGQMVAAADKKLNPTGVFREYAIPAVERLASAVAQLQGFASDPSTSLSPQSFDPLDEMLRLVPICWQRSEKLISLGQVTMTSELSEHMASLMLASLMLASLMLASLMLASHFFCLRLS